MGILFEIAWWLARHMHPSNTAIVLFTSDSKSLADIVNGIPREAVIRAVYAKWSKAA